MCITAMIILLLVAGLAVLFARRNGKRIINLYKIEINRVENELRANAGEPDFLPDCSQYETVTAVVPYTEETSVSFYDADTNYHIADIDGTLYRIEYTIDLSKERSNLYKSTFVVIGIIVAAAVLLLIYIYLRIIKTFNKISGYPAELSKGNLTLPLTEEKNKYFGQFLWGLDMLREKLEDEKARNLELQKEKNVFLLSLSHYMKTPISAVRLSAAALKKNLYKDEDKLHEVADKIDENVAEIEKYVSKITSSSGDDFLDLNVREGEFYLAEAINPIKEYYADKLETVGTEFTVEDYTDVLLRGDRDRFIEVLQNILENAVKYGDGGYIRVSFSDEEDARLVTISDSGCTLDANEAEHIFDSFYRGSNVGSRPGSGLGLYIARKLMLRMGGEVFAEQADGVMSVTVVLHKSL
ncbi:MAG: HAMP domain-containing histidine kinase [Lachnospiraceae bacterium]|nr:HAMP domain-containing histidine kinase [Lachnospiraceae bacterium]